MRRKSKKKESFLTNKNGKILLIFGFMLVIMLGASTAFDVYYFGPSSAWEADVEITGVQDGEDWYTGVDEILNLGGFPSARIVKVDFDGDMIEQHSDTSIVSYDHGILGVREYPLFNHDDAGMKPTVDISVGQLFLSDSDGNLVNEYYEWDDVDNETGLLRFYFAFSVAFTTRASMVSSDYDFEYLLATESYNDEYLWVTREPMPEIGRQVVQTRVDLRVGNNLNYTYKGAVEGVDLVNTRTRYTYTAGEMGVSDVDLSTFNSEYDWKGRWETGVASELSPSNPVTLQLDTIDTEAENMAVLTCGAMLKPGFDMNEILTSPIENGEVVPVEGVAVYNVELIYDLVCEVTLNGIPLTAKGEVLSGRTDYIFVPPKDPEPINWFDYWWVLVLAAFLIFGGSASRRR